MRVKCDKSDCFQNQCGAACNLLDRPITDHDCPFYQTVMEVYVGRADAHQKLLEKGRLDLIGYYEQNPNRNW